MTIKEIAPIADADKKMALVMCSSSPADGPDKPPC